MARPLSEDVIILEGVSFDAIGRLRDLTGSFKDTFLDDEALQDLLLNSDAFTKQFLLTPEEEQMFLSERRPVLMD